MNKKFAAILAFALLAGCAGLPPGVSAENGRVWQHRCPAAGTVVRTSENLTMTYAGEAAPGVCRRSDGRTVLYGIWLVPVGETRTEEQTWLGGMFPAAAGKSGRMSVIGRSSDGRSQTTSMWLRDASVLGFQTLDLPAGRRDAVLIEWVERGMSGNTHVQRQRRWLDTETGALIRSQGVVESGTSYRGAEHDWHAVAVTTPNRRTP